MGNLLVERLVGAHIDLISEEDYTEIGGEVHTLQNPCLSSSSYYKSL